MFVKIFVATVRYNFGRFTGLIESTLKMWTPFIFIDLANFYSRWFSISFLFSSLILPWSHYLIIFPSFHSIYLRPTRRRRRRREPVTSATFLIWLNFDRCLFENKEIFFVERGNGLKQRLAFDKTAGLSKITLSFDSINTLYRKLLLFLCKLTGWLSQLCSRFQMLICRTINQFSA